MELLTLGGLMALFLIPLFHPGSAERLDDLEAFWDEPKRVPRSLGGRSLLYRSNRVA